MAKQPHMVPETHQEWSLSTDLWVTQPGGIHPKRNKKANQQTILPLATKHRERDIPFGWYRNKSSLNLRKRLNMDSVNADVYKRTSGGAVG